jgi:hypothetical protein
MMQPKDLAMKTKMLPVTVLAAVLAGFAALTAPAQNAGGTNAADAVQPVAQDNPVALPYGVPEVLKLVQAQVGDDTTIAYIQNSGTLYGLTASEIIYLRQQGVSDRVLSAMLNKRSQTAAAASSPQASQPDPNANASANNSTQPGAIQPTAVCVEAPPAPVQNSTVYVIPNTGPGPVVDYGYYPYYYSGYWYPPVAFTFGFGGGRYWGGYRGGHYGGGVHVFGGGGFGHHR